MAQPRAAGRLRIALPEGRKKSSPRKSTPTDGDTKDSAKAAEIKIGPRLRHARLVQKLKLRELAERLDCSESFLSKLENDKVRPSLTMLHRIVRILDINIVALFSGPHTDVPVRIVRADMRPVIRTDPPRRGRGISLEGLVAAEPTGLLAAAVHCVDPGGHTDGMIEHPGEEVGFVLEGRLELNVEGVIYPLGPGDCFFFRSELKHGYRNPGKVVTRVLWVNTPPTF